MVKLQPAQLRAAFEIYRHTDVFFPLIGAVLEGTQDGVAFADNTDRPRQFYVEHCFGFAQVFGMPSLAFEAWLERYLFADKAFEATKVRLYGTYVPPFLMQPQYLQLRSKRQRFVMEEARLAANDEQGATGAWGLDAVSVNAANFSPMDAAFNVAGRFWRSPEDFIQMAHAVMVLREGQPAAICYAAGVSGVRAEIDVLTLPEHRGQGAAKRAVVAFASHCFASSLEPVWDCFSNNAASVALCMSAGFVPKGSEYPFFTIDR